ncbi:MAG: polysaccharide deacetylase family protein, partial [Acidimicrobiia bacterium]
MKIGRVAAVAVLAVTGLVPFVGVPGAGATANPAFSAFDLADPPAPPGSPVVALTFDDGPSPQITPGVLDTLAANGATATFFVIGNWANAHPDLVRRAVDLGNSVQVHTMSHARLDRLSTAQIDAEIDPEISLLTNLTGRRPSCLRPPYGAWNGTVVNAAASRGLATVMWNVNPGDTEAGATSGSIASRALAGARPGAIIAMHDSGAKGATLAALPTILAGLRARGLAPVSMCSGSVPTRDVAVRADGRSGYTLDANGALHEFGGAPPILGSAMLPHLARRVVLRSDGRSGYVLDGFGGIHPFGGAPNPTGGTAYWPGWDIARGIALRPDGQSGWVLDGFGGVHPWGGAPEVTQPAYWPGWDIARAIVATPGGAGGYVLDGFGGLHPFGSAAPARNGPYWPGSDRARAIVLGFDGRSGWVLDAAGTLSRFGA